MPKLENVFRAMREEAIASAEKRLSRELTTEERRGIESIASGMMLESVCQEFSSNKVSAASIESTLAHFAMEADKSR